MSTEQPKYVSNDLFSHHLDLLGSHIRFLEGAAGNIRQNAAAHQLSPHVAADHLASVEVMREAALKAFDNALHLQTRAIGPAREVPVHNSAAEMPAAPRPTSPSKRSADALLALPALPQPSRKRQRLSPPQPKRPLPPPVTASTSSRQTIQGQRDPTYAHGTPQTLHNRSPKRQRTQWPEPEEMDISDEVEARLELNRRRREARVRATLNGDGTGTEGVASVVKVKRKRESGHDDGSATTTIKTERDDEVEIRHENKENRGAATGSVRAKKRTRRMTRSREGLSEADLSTKAIELWDI